MSAAATTASETYVRVKIIGTLTLQTATSIGDGDVTRISAHKGEIATVIRAPNRQPVIPASSLKGVLRSRLTELNVDKDLVESIFGRESQRSAGGAPSPDSGQGGKFEFRFATITTPAPDTETDGGTAAASTAEQPDQQPDEQNGGGNSPSSVSTEQSVAIDRITRAAADRQLFARQNVQPGTTFQVEIEGFRVTEDEIARLLGALEEFNHASNPIRLGAGTANDRGRAAWQLGSVQGHTAETVNKWLDESGEASSIWQYAESLTLNPATLRSPDADNHLLKIQLRLHFDSWFLVRDPKASKPKDSQDDESSKVDAFPLLSPDGRVMLRARGFRGVLRSQFEKIARTLVPDAGGDPNRPGNHVIVETLFGASGAATVCSTSDFLDERPALRWEGNHNEKPPVELTNGTKTWLGKREFVAIDRFTGGAADKLKFDCVAAWRPTLAGTMTIDLNKLKQRFDWWQEQQHAANKTTTGDAKKAGEARRDSEQAPENTFSFAAVLGLLFLTLRDLADGDLAFGYGFGKGFGQCRGEIVSISPTSAAPLAELVGIDDATFQNALTEENRRESVPDAYSKLDAEWRAFWRCCVEQCREWAEEHNPRAAT